MNQQNFTQKSKNLFSYQCQNHPGFLCDLINLNGDYQQRLLCFQCAQENTIPYSELLHIKMILEISEGQALRMYPPLKDEELSKQIMAMNSIQNLQRVQTLEGIEDFFNKIKKDIEEAINESKKIAKQNFVQNESKCKLIFEGYNQIAEIEKLKNILLSNEETFEKQLDDFIKDKWKNAETNRNILSTLIQQQNLKQAINLVIPNQIGAEIVQNIKNLKFFKPIDNHSFSLIKSTFQDSQNLEINKISNKSYEIKKNQNSGFSQTFVDPILDPDLKYVFQIDLEQPPNASHNEFMFGLVEDSLKDTKAAYSQSMSYYDVNNGWGISNYIRGGDMTSGNIEKAKHSFEIRIHLNQKVLKVSSLPDYASVAQLQIPSKIVPQTPYRFYLGLFRSGTMVIRDWQVVSEFDNNM